MAERIKGALIGHEHRVTGQDKVTAANKEVAGSFDGVADGMKSVFGKGGIAVVAANQAIQLAQELGQLVKAAGELAKTGAQLSDLERAFEGLGGTAEDMDKLRDAFANAVSDRTILRMANTAASLGITTESFEKLGRVAVQQAKITGESVDFLLESLVTGVARESPRRIDNAGIVIANSAERMRLELEKLGVSADEATAAMRKTALANLIAEEAAALSAAGGFKSLGAEVASIGVQLENMKDRAAQGFAEFLESEGILDAMSAGLESAAGWLAENRRTASYSRRWAAL
jgi:hypothetical protein